MDYLQRLIVLLFAFFTLSASADTTVYNGQTLYRIAVPGYSVFGVGASTPQSACTASASNQASGCQSTSYISSTTGPGSCKVTCTSGYNTTQAIAFDCGTGNVKINGATNWGCWSSVDPTPPVVCPAGQSRDPGTNTCGCDSGYQVGGQMVSGDAIKGCKGGCSILLRSGWYDKTANVTWGRDWAQTGSACVVGDPPVLSPTDPKVTEAQKCGAGQCPGTVNGQPVCVACTAPRETGTTNDSSTEVSTPASGASSVSSSSSSGASTTKCDGDKCTTTTTTTTTNPDGSKSDKTTTKQEPKADFCTDNPKSSICKDGGTWGGTCGSFTCDGDAVQCAQAKGSWELACSLKVEATDTTVQAGTAAMAKTDESSIKAQLGGVNAALDLASRLDSTSLFGTPGACPADVTLTTGIGALVLPFSSLCPQLNLIGVAMMGLAYLIAAFVVFRPSKGA